jgi:mannosyltransferase OCH1-like enzyme
MNTIYYLWNFKPDEKSEFNNDVVINNLNYLNCYKILRPIDVEKYISMYSNELNYLYYKLPNWIIKTDICRLIYIYFNGGMYSDADCYITKDFLNKIQNNNIILFIERIVKLTELSSLENKSLECSIRIANYAFFSNSIQHPFLKEVIDECISRIKILLNLNKKIVSEEEILWVCGPDVITTIYHKSKKNYNDILLLNDNYLNHKCYRSWRNTII